MLVYRFTNLANGKVYVGQTRYSLKRRLGLHKWCVANRSKQAIHAALSKYGWNNFRIEILHEAESFNELDAMETFFIVLHQSFRPEYGYNRSLGGYKRNNAGQTPWNKGLKDVQVAWNKGAEMSGDFRAKCKNGNAVSAAHARTFIGPHTQERRIQMSAKMSGSNNPFAGRKHSPETRQKMREAKLCRIASDPDYINSLLSNLKTEA